MTSTRGPSAPARNLRPAADPVRPDASFARELFLGHFRPGLIHPPPAPDPGDIQRGEQFLARLRELCETAVEGARIDREAHIPDEVITGLKAIGALGMRTAPDYGGLGLSQLYYHRALMLAGSASPAVGALLSAHQSMGVPQPVRLFGTEEQRQRYLPRCARDTFSAFLLAEPGSGSDPARLTTRAAPEGGEYVLDGVKLWIANGALADLLLVLARVPERPGHPGGVTAFVVEAGSQGVTVEHRNTFMGLRGNESGVTRFHQVRVPADQRIGAEGEGLRIARATLDAGRLAQPAMCVAAGKWCLRIAREWTGVGEPRGEPLGVHEAVAAKVSFIAATTFALEALLDLAAERVDHRRGDIRVEAAITKLYASEMAWRMADELVQLRGGRGYETAGSLAARGERGIPAEQLLRDLRGHRISGGSSEVMRLLIARDTVDAHLRVAGDLIETETTLTDKRRATLAASAFYVRWLPGLLVGRGLAPLTYGDFRVPGYPGLSGHLRYVERTARKLARSVFYGVVRWHGRLECRQRFLGRIVDIGAELLAMSAACVRAERMRSGSGHGREPYQLADAFCRQARLRVDELFRRLWHHSDEQDRALAQEVLAGEHRWLEDGALDASSEGPWVQDVTPGPSTRENLRRRPG